MDELNQLNILEATHPLAPKCNEKNDYYGKFIAEINIKSNQL